MCDKTAYFQGNLIAKAEIFTLAAILILTGTLLNQPACGLWELHHLWMRDHTLPENLLTTQEDHPATRRAQPLPQSLQ